MSNRDRAKKSRETNGLTAGAYFPFGFHFRFHWFHGLNDTQVDNIETNAKT